MGTQLLYYLGSSFASQVQVSPDFWIAAPTSILFLSCFVMSMCSGACIFVSVSSKPDKHCFTKRVIFWNAMGCVDILLYSELIESINI